MKEKIANPIETIAKEAIKEKEAEVLCNPEEIKEFIGKSLKELLETQRNDLLRTEQELFEKDGDVGNGH